MILVLSFRLLCLVALATSCTTDPASNAAASDESQPTPEVTEEPASTTTAPSPVATRSTAPPVAVAPDPCAASLDQSRVDLRPSGNRWSDVRLQLDDLEATNIELPATARWVLTDPIQQLGWYVVLDDGSALRVTEAGQIIAAPPPLSVPPELAENGEPVSAFSLHSWFNDPLLDSRVVSSVSVLASLSSPTDRYGHGVLGDAIEAAAIEWVDRCSDDAGTIEIAAPDVIEGISPLLADIDDDGQPEIIVTLSNGDSGARLAAFELDGTLLAESAPIGRGNRWRNQLAVGPFGPAGETELVDVRTPHIGGTVQAFRLERSGLGPATLERVAASDSNYTSHVLGSRNLDMAVGLFLDADETLDVLVPTADRSTLVGLTRTGDTWTTLGELGLDGRLTTNLMVQQSGDRTVLAAGVGNHLRVWQN